MCERAAPPRQNGALGMLEIRHRLLYAEFCSTFRNRHNGRALGDLGHFAQLPLSGIKMIVTARHTGLLI
jgi:hypothetical protein